MKTSFWEASCLDKFSSIADRMRVRIPRWIDSRHPFSFFLRLWFFFFFSFSVCCIPFLAFCPSSLFLLDFCGRASVKLPVCWQLTSLRINSRSESCEDVCNRWSVGRLQLQLQLHAWVSERACSQTRIARCLHATSRSRYQASIVQIFMSPARLASRLYDAEFHSCHAVKKHASLVGGEPNARCSSRDLKEGSLL